jgi:Flp pilus assembly pilin Flp
MNLLNALWNDEAGFVVSTELALIATILVIGMVVGLTSIRDQVVQELADIAGMVSQLNQSYSFSAITGHHSNTAGSYGVDFIDSCDIACGDRTGNGAVCVDVCNVNAAHEGS